MTYNISHALIGRPLMVEGEDAIRKLLEHAAIKADGFEMPEPEDDKETESPVCVIDVKGTLIHSGPDWLNYYGYCTYNSIREKIAEAATAGKHVVLNVNSGGGEASGCFELADFIRSFRGSGTKIYGSANGYACSAAYELLAACERVYVSKYTKVGSIGVYAVYADQSEFDKKIGVKYTFVKAGEHKAEMNGHEPLTGGAKDRLQALVNFDYQAFTASVASNRGISVDAVIATKADLMTPDAAVPNFADRIGELSDVIADMQMELKAASEPAIANPMLLDGMTAEQVNLLAERLCARIKAASEVEITTSEDQARQYIPAPALNAWRNEMPGLKMHNGLKEFRLDAPQSIADNAASQLLELGWKMRCDTQAAELEHIEVDGHVIVSGCVAPYGKPSMMLPGGIREVYERGCFAESLSGDIYADAHHDPMQILGRTTSGTLRFLDRADGLYFEIDMPDTSYSRDLQESMSRGDIKGSSGAFYLRNGGFKMEQRSDGLYRVITKAELVAASIVPKQAYPDADAKIQPKAEAKAIKADTDPVPALELELLEARLRLLALSN